MRAHETSRHSEYLSKVAGSVPVAYVGNMPVNDPSPPPPTYISTQAAAERLGVTPVTIRTLLGTEIEGARFGRVLKVNVASLEEYRQRQTIRRP